MKREDGKIWNEAKKHATLVSANWNLKTTRGAFIAEYTERRWLADENNWLLMHIRSLGGRIGALKKRIAALEKGGGK